LLNGCSGRFLDARIAGQIKVIVRAEHQDFSVAKHDLAWAAAFPSAKGFKVDVKSGLLQGAARLNFQHFSKMSLRSGRGPLG